MSEFKHHMEELLQQYVADNSSALGHDRPLPAHLRVLPSWMTHIHFWDDSSVYSECSHLFNYRHLVKRIQNIPTSIITQEILRADALTAILERIRDFLTPEGVWQSSPNQFDKLYATTSVLYFLLQLGVPVLHPIVTTPLKFLDSVKEMSIDTRAKWFFDIMTHRISEINTVAFLDLLRKSQFSSQGYPDSAISFLFAQEDSTSKDPNWLKRHKYGTYSHALHIADVLLHLDTRTMRKEDCTYLLTGIREFIMCVLSNSNGLIPSQNRGINKQLTLWSYALAKPLGYTLPDTWQEVFIQILSNLEIEDSSRLLFLL